MVLQLQPDYELHSKGIANSKEVLPGNSIESLSPATNTSPNGSINNNYDKNSTETVQLKREIGLVNAVTLSVGFMIGSGIFISPQIALLHSGSIGLCLVIWVLSGVISLAGAASFAELSTVVPKSGAEYIYLLEAYKELHRFWGPLPAFLAAWMNVFILSPSAIAVILLTFSEYICQTLHSYLLPLSEYERDVVKKLIALLGLAIMTYINVMSVKLYLWMQNLFTAGKLVACTVVIAGGVFELCYGRTTNISTGFEGTSTSAKDLALAFYGCLWSYGGWAAITNVTEEVRKPEKNIFRSIMIALPVVTVFYLMMNVSYMTVLTKPEILAAPAVAVVFGDRLLGVMSFIIPLGVALSTFGCALTSQFTITRLCYAASKEGHMMEAFSYIHVTRVTPAPAVILQGLLGLLFLLSGDIKTLISFCSFLTWAFYAVTMVGLLIMRKTKKNANRPLKVPLVFPLFMIVVALFLCIVPIITDPSPLYFIALFLIGVGFCIYIPLVYFKIRPKFMDKVTYLIQVIMHVIPPNGDPEEKKTNG